MLPLLLQDYQQCGAIHSHCYRSVIDGIEHIAMVKGDNGNGQDVLVGVHSECLTGDIFGSARCNSGNQLALAMQQIEAAGRGMLVYLQGHEGRGIGLEHKLSAYNLQGDGHNPVEANVQLGLPVDSRDYGTVAQDNEANDEQPSKYVGLEGYVLTIARRVPLVTPTTKENKRYLETNWEESTGECEEVGGVGSGKDDGAATSADADEGRPTDAGGLAPPPSPPRSPSPFACSLRALVMHMLPSDTAYMRPIKLRTGLSMAQKNKD
ncbi:hypothetical protein NL676_039243 [Syzygium grande]|nr:hypothetical protein NL676_039243 [Syzygium grande]